MAEKAILYDATRCTACRGCQGACKQWNENDEEIPTIENGVDAKNTGSYENPPELSPQTWLKIGFNEVERSDGLAWLFTRQSCRHCTDAGCVEVCPNGSLYHDDMGFVAYNRDTCTGCGYCGDACPFGVPTFTRNRLTGVAKMDKCILCTSPGLNRINEGLEPACVKACPTNALTFGDRTVLAADGNSRVAALVAAGRRDARLYGGTELGGLHVMSVLDDAAEVYGLPENPTVPATVGFWKSFLQPVGSVLGIAAIAGLAINYYAARRAHVAHSRGKEE